MDLSQGTVHENLTDRGFEVIDRNDLRTNFSDLSAPVNLLDLSYAESKPVPKDGFPSLFISGYAVEAT